MKLSHQPISLEPAQTLILEPFSDLQRQATPKVKEPTVYMNLNGGGELTPVSAASRLTHGSMGDFDINMPLSGTSGIEDRTSPTYNAVFSFKAPVTSGDMIVVSGTAKVGAITFNGSEMIAQLTGVTAVEVVTLRAENVNGDGVTGDVPFGFLTGDADGDRIVDQPDATQVKMHRNQAVTVANFRDDIDLSGVIDKPDYEMVKMNKKHRIH
jgi:hypothetical protein